MSILPKKERRREGFAPLPPLWKAAVEKPPRLDAYTRRKNAGQPPFYRRTASAVRDRKTPAPPFPGSAGAHSCHPYTTERAPAALSPNYTILLACALRFLLCVYDLSSHEFLAMTGFHPSSLAASIISLRLQCRSRGELHPVPFRRSPGLLQLGQQPCSILGLLMKFYGIIYPFRGIMILVGVGVKFSFVNLYNLRK